MMKHIIKKIAMSTLAISLVSTVLIANAATPGWDNLGYSNDTWVQDSATIEFNVNDEGGSQIKSFKQVDASGVEIPDSGLTFNPATGIGELTVTSNQTYYFVAIDNATNETKGEIEVTNIDLNVPVISLSASNTELTNKPVTLTAVFTDVEGVKDITLPDGSVVSGGGATSVTKTFEVSESKTYTFSVEDVSGRIETKDILVDNISIGDVTITVADYNKNWNNTSMSITATATDSKGAPLTPQTLEFNTEGEHEVKFVFTDAWGNTATSIGVVKIDMTKPTISISTK